MDGVNPFDIHTRYVGTGATTGACVDLLCALELLAELGGIGAMVRGGD